MTRNPIRLLPHQKTTVAAAPVATSADLSAHEVSQSSDVKVRLTGQGLVSAVCGEENHFTIDGSGSTESGRPEVTVSGAKTDLHVKLKNVGYNLYQVLLTPGFLRCTFN